MLSAHLAYWVISLLAQGIAWNRDIKSCRPYTDTALTRVRRIRANSSVALASAAPEHVAQHSGTGSRAAGWNGLDKRGGIILIRGTEIGAVRDWTVADHPQASRQLRRSQRRDGTVAADVLLPALL